MTIARFAITTSFIMNEVELTEKKLYVILTILGLLLASFTIKCGVTESFI